MKVTLKIYKMLRKKLQSRALAILAVFFFAFLYSFGFLHTTLASASSATWKNHNVITVNGVDYTVCSITDTNCLSYGTNTYTAYLPSGWVIPQPQVQNSLSNLCNAGNIAQVAGHIAVIDAGGGNFFADTFKQGGNSNCWTPDKLSFTNSQPAAAPGDPTWGAGGNTSTGGGGTSTDVCTSGGTDVNGAAKGCDDSALDCGGGALNWIMCPVITLAQGAAEKVDAFIMSTLDIDVGGIFNTAGGGSAQTGYYTAWNSFRVIATVVIVIAALVMVSSQALGFELLGAYTIRKVLPRLIIAIVGITLSWPLMEFTVKFFDTVGVDIRELIYHPFAANIKVTLGTQASFASILLLAGGAMVLGFASLTLLLTAALAIFVGFLILIIRQVAIIILIIMAPVAIACYVLPNTQKVWKLWVDNFLGLMLMFPIISAFIAAGHVFAVVALSNGAGDTPASTITQIIGIIAYFVPYFMLPVAFRLATGVIGTVAGFVNDRHRGAFDRMKGYRSKQSADRIKRMQSQSLYDNSTRRGRIGNKIATWATDPASNAAYYGRNIPGLKKRGQKVATQIEHAKMEQSAKLFQELNNMGYNDKAYRALSGAHGTFNPDGSYKGELDEVTAHKLQDAGLFGRAPQSLAEVQKLSEIMSESSSGSERLAGNAIHGSMGRLGTLYQDSDMTKANLAAAGILGLSSHGFANNDDIAQVANTLQANDGVGLAQSVAIQAQLAGQRAGRPDVKAGYGLVYQPGEGDHGGSFQNALKVSAEDGGRGLALIQSLASQDLAGAKKGAIKELEPIIRSVISEGSGPGASELQKRNAQAVKEQLYQWAGPHSYASVDVKSEALRLINDGALGAATEGRLADEFKRYSAPSPEDIEAARRAGETPPEPPPGPGEPPA